MMNFEITNFINTASKSIQVRSRADIYGFINLSNNEMIHSRLTSLLMEFGKHYDWSRVRHYPNCEQIRKKVSKLYQLEHDQILLTAGTDHAISQILPFLSFKTNTLILQTPNFFNYENYAHVNAIKIIPVDFYGLSDNDMRNEFYTQTKNNPNSIVILTSPHVYTGMCLPATLISEIVEICQKHGCLIVIDEAYYAFSEEDNIYLLKQNYLNVIILRSFSKAFGVAGMRIGGVFAKQDIITYLMKIGVLGCVNDPAICLLSYLIDQYHEILKIRKDLCDVRDYAITFISTLFPQWLVMPSKSNFITFIVESSKVSDSITEFMNSNKFLIKQLKNIAPFNNAIRITVADKAVIDNIFDCLVIWKKRFYKIETDRRNIVDG